MGHLRLLVGQTAGFQFVKKPPNARTGDCHAPIFAGAHCDSGILRSGTLATPNAIGALDGPIEARIVPATSGFFRQVGLAGRSSATFRSPRSKAGLIPTTRAGTTRESARRQRGLAGSLLAGAVTQPAASMVVPRDTS